MSNDKFIDTISCTIRILVRLHLHCKLENCFITSLVKMKTPYSSAVFVSSLKATFIFKVYLIQFYLKYLEYTTILLGILVTISSVVLFFSQLLFKNLTCSSTFLLGEFLKWCSFNVFHAKFKQPTNSTNQNKVSSCIKLFDVLKLFRVS